MSFEKIIQFTLQYEGGYVNDPYDPGGETNFGITKRSYPHEDIKGLTKGRATEIYEKDFWNKLTIEDDKTRMVAFDTAVNIGLGRIDGFMMGNPGWEEFITRREEYYNCLVIRNPKMKKYIKGWMNRTAALRKFIGEA
jgi:hypothetical protein